MKVMVNGEQRDAVAGTTLVDIVSEIRGDPRAKGVAVALNGEVVPRAEWQNSAVSDGDRVEILSAVQGG